jgi:hypothetical protein
LRALHERMERSFVAVDLRNAELAGADVFNKPYADASTSRAVRTT